MNSHVTRIILACACLAAVPAVDVPAPDAMPDAQSFAVVVIPDLRATITHVEATAAAFGKPIPAGMIAMALGSQIGDPGLANLGAGPIFAVVGPGIPLPTWAVIVPTLKPAAYAAAVAPHGLAAEALANSVVLAQTIDGVDLGKRLTPALAGLSPTTPSTDLRLILASDRLAAAYLPFFTQLLNQGIQANQLSQGNEQAVQFLNIFSAVAPPLLRESGTLQLDVALSAKGLRFETLQAPRPDGIFAKGLVAPRPAGAKPLADRLGTGNGHLTMVGRINPALITAMADFLTPFITNPKTSGIFTPELVDMIRDGAAVCTGEMAVRQGVDGAMAAQEGYYGINDAAKATKLAERMAALMAAGTLAEFYKTMGFTINLQPAFRAGPAGERIDRLSFAFDASKLPPGQADMMAQMLKPSEFAFAPDAVVMSADPARLDRLLGAGFGPCTLAAEKTLGQGWDGYIDYDLGVQLRNQVKLMPGGANGPGAALARMPVGIPLAIAWAIRDGRARTVVDIPMTLATTIQRTVAGDGAEAAPLNAPPVF